MQIRFPMIRTPEDRAAERFAGAPSSADTQDRPPVSGPAVFPRNRRPGSHRVQPTHTEAGKVGVRPVHYTHLNHPMTGVPR